MAVAFEQLDVPGFTVPVHRALTEHILLGGAPRSIAILNGTLAGAVGLGLRLWLVGLAIWAIGHFAAVWAAKRDPLFVEVGRRHLRIFDHGDGRRFGRCRFHHPYRQGSARLGEANAALAAPFARRPDHDPRRPLRRQPRLRFFHQPL